MNYTDVRTRSSSGGGEGVEPQALAQVTWKSTPPPDRPECSAGDRTHERREIERIVGMIEALIARGYAYAVGGDVYFRVAHDIDYGRLSGRKLEEMRAGARLEIDERKQDPADFALWKAAKPGEPSWDSPWGKGRPGGTNAAMNLEYLGEQIDIHGGARLDLPAPRGESPDEPDRKPSPLLDPQRDAAAQWRENVEVAGQPGDGR
jgi:cysteinyl-tRNA synthetase